MTGAQVVLGAMNYGTTVDERRAVELLDTFVERGGEWIDTADCYSFWNDPSGVGGASKHVLGSWLAARPGAPVKISTKVRHQRCGCSTTRSRTTRPTDAHVAARTRAASRSADTLRTPARDPASFAVRCSPTVIGG